MDTDFRQDFTERWNHAFAGAELPIAFYYTDDGQRGERLPPATVSRCLICDLALVRRGRLLSFDTETVACPGGRRYLGFAQGLRPSFEYFLSCGIPGEMDGERYKQSPELVRTFLQNQPPFKAPAPNIVFKRWDMLDEADEPQVVIFFATADVLAGLFTLANFDEADSQAVIAPFGSGCGSIVYQPYQQLNSDQPRAVLGMFDVSARPCVPPDRLTLAIPWPKFTRMAQQMDESFLITPAWAKVRSRLEQANQGVGSTAG